MAKTKGIILLIDGVLNDQWVSGEVNRDMKDFAGDFSFTFRDKFRSDQALAYASLGPAYKLRPGPTVEIKINGTTVLKGKIEEVAPTIEEASAEVTISGRDPTGDLVDSAALVDGPSEFKNVKLEDAVTRIAKPFGLKVKSEVDTGEPFPRYSLDLSETAFSAIEKGTRSRHVLVLSDGVGNVVITRTGKERAPADISLPGNALSASGKFSHKGRHSETIVRGQGEKAGKQRTGSAMDATAEPLAPGDRQPGDGSATEKERKGTTATGRAKDDEITSYRPQVHLARSKADGASAQDEADFKMRTARAESEEKSYTVKGHDVNGQLWRVNELAYVSDAFLDVERDMLISKVSYREDASGRITGLTVSSPEAFDKAPVGNRRTNQKGKSKGKGKTSGSLDSTAQGL